MALERSPVAAARPSTPAPSHESEAPFDERWAAWQAKGAARDRAFRRKLALAPSRSSSSQSLSSPCSPERRAAFRRACASIEIREWPGRSITVVGGSHYPDDVSRMSVALDFDHGAEP